MRAFSQKGYPYKQKVRDRRSRLVFITQDVDREAIEKTFRAFHQVLPQARESVL